MGSGGKDSGPTGPGTRGPASADSGRRPSPVARRLPVPAYSLQPTVYSLLVLDHFRHPRHAGRLEPGPQVIMTRAGRREAGAELALWFKVVAGKVVDLRFQAFGCPHFIAAASLAGDGLLGMEAARLAGWRAGDLGEQLEFPVEKRGKLLILEDAVRAAAQYRVD